MTASGHLHTVQRIDNALAVAQSNPVQAGAQIRGARQELARLGRYFQLRDRNARFGLPDVVPDMWLNVDSVEVATAVPAANNPNALVPGGQIIWPWNGIVVCMAMGAAEGPAYAQDLRLALKINDGSGGNDFVSNGQASTSVTFQALTVQGLGYLWMPIARRVKNKDVWQASIYVRAGAPTGTFANRTPFLAFGVKLDQDANSDA